LLSVLVAALIGAFLLIPPQPPGNPGSDIAVHVYRAASYLGQKGHGNLHNGLVQFGDWICKARLKAAFSRGELVRVQVSSDSAQDFISAGRDIVSRMARVGVRPVAGGCYPHPDRPEGYEIFFRKQDEGLLRLEGVSLDISGRGK